MFACVFGYFFAFPHFVYDMIDKKYSKNFTIVTGIITVAFVLITLFTALLVSNKVVDFSGVNRPAKTNYLYLFVTLLTLFACYVFIQAIKFQRNNKQMLINIKPMIIGICLAIFFGIVDIVGTFLNKPLIPNIHDPFVFGIFFIMITFASSFLSQYSMLFANLNKSRDEIEKLIAKSNKNLMEFVQLIAKTLDAKDEYTAGHSLRVLDYAVKIANELGLSKNDIEILKQACLLHDIGKIGIPDGILNKKTPLNEKEMRYIKNHPILGKKILGTVSEFEPILEIVYAHHERVDGKGYPEGIGKDKIPLLSRIIAVADTFDAITSERPYRKAKKKQEALEEMFAVKDSQLDSQIVDVFVKIIQEY